MFTQRRDSKTKNHTGILLLLWWYEYNKIINNNCALRINIQKNFVEYLFAKKYSKEMISTEMHVVVTVATSTVVAVATVGNYDNLLATKVQQPL